MELRHQALRVLALDDPVAKASATRGLHTLAGTGLTLDCDCKLEPQATLPGRPARPRLVAATSLPKRSPFTPLGRAGLLHSVAHIEFNAIKTVYNEDNSAIPAEISSRRQAKTPEPATPPR